MSGNILFGGGGVLLRQGTTTAVAYLVGLPAYIACLVRQHICMCGHLAHCPPEQVPWELAIDAIWFLAFLTSGVAGLRQGHRRMRWLGVASLVLAFTRVVLCSCGGYCVIFPELPLVVFALWLAVSHLAGSHAAVAGPDAEPSAGPSDLNEK